MLFWEQCQWTFISPRAKMSAMVSYSISYIASFKAYSIIYMIIVIREVQYERYED